MAEAINCSSKPCKIGFKPLLDGYGSASIAVCGIEMIALDDDGFCVDVTDPKNTNVYYVIHIYNKVWDLDGKIHNFNMPQTIITNGEVYYLVDHRFSLFRNENTSVYKGDIEAILENFTGNNSPSQEKPWLITHKN